MFGRIGVRVFGGTLLASLLRFPALQVFVLFVALDDLGDQMVAHHIFLVHEDEINARDFPQNAMCLDQTGLLVLGQVYLGNVAGDEEFGVLAHAGEEHLELCSGGVLRLVKDDVCIVESTSAHEGQGSYLDDFVFHVGDEFLHGHHVPQCVVEWLEVGVEFVAQVTGQESEVFASFDGGAGEDDAADLLVLEGAHGQGHGSIGLASAGRPDDKDHVVFVCAVH